MIVTVTMNPAIDKTVDIDRFERGDLNRIKRVESDAGGKGINVSKTIKELGGES
ncbi:MAG TPA: 1-phosphofructokinase, partial [Lachnoclostridium sp.]|nr:1-phosphofructokinase [Lachnoclostridium sp.]